MQINRLELKNFRGFSEREFHFHPQFNLIVGENGSGKTALLEALSIAAGSWFLGLKEKFDARHIRPDDVSFVWFEEHGTPQYPCEILAKGSIWGAELSWQRTKGSQAGRTTQIHAQEIYKLSEKADEKVRSNQSVSLPLISYYGTERLWQDPRQTATKSRPNQRLLGYETSVDSRIDKKELIKWFSKKDSKNNKTEQSDFILVKKALLETLEHCGEIEYDIDLEEIVLTIHQHKKRLAHLSDGYRNLFFLVLDIAQKAITLNHSELGENTLKETQGVVLIDELDMHLHPKWQRRIIDILRNIFPKIQFFCTTHSPFLIQSLHSKDELLMLNDEGKVDLANKSINDIALEIQNVETIGYNQIYQNMKDNAREYLTYLAGTCDTPKKRYEQFMADCRNPNMHLIHADNPAFQAFLEMKWEAANSTDEENGD